MAVELAEVGQTRGAHPDHEVLILGQVWNAQDRVRAASASPPTRVYGAVASVPSRRWVRLCVRARDALETHPLYTAQLGGGTAVVLVYAVTPYLFLSDGHAMPVSEKL